jgi:FkbM family methyltransferase
MILDFDYVHKKYNLNITGILHIGGHYGNVISDYQKYGVNNIVLFEPLYENFSILSENIKKTNANIIAHQVALGNDNKKVLMNVSDNEGQSSSVLNPKVHLTVHPEVSFIGTEEVEMKKLDDYNYNDYNMMVIDVQGYELEVFRGGVKTLENIDYIFCEVNRDEVYEGNAKIEEVDDFLLKQGFERVEVEWYYSQVFGDAFYIRNKKKNPNANVSLICACKNRYNALKLSLTSWLMFDEVKEVIIVDWSSDNPINDLLQLDDRVKIIRVEDKKYFNLSQPLNLAASLVTGDYILKVDCDYLFNPYYNFFQDYKIDESSFLTGNSNYKNFEFYDENNQLKVSSLDMTSDDMVDYVNSYSDYFRYLKGLLFVSRENFLKIGGFEEDIQSYGWEDGEITKRLEKLNLEHKKIKFDYKLTHIPHPDKKRFEYSKDYNQQDEEYFRNIMEPQYSPESLPFELDYALTMHYTEKNKNRLIEIGKLSENNSADYGYTINSDCFVRPKTEWYIKEVKQNYYMASEKVLDVEVDTTKLLNFPSVYYVTLEESVERQVELERQFNQYGIVPIPIKSKRFSESHDVISGKYVYQLNDGTKGCCVSHLKAIKEWYNTTDENYAFFCEDDITLETVPYWNFMWEQFVEKIPEDAECVQLFTIRDNFDTFSLRERYWNDWGVSAYILTRDYAKKIIDTYIKGDEYVLEIPNQDIMPLIENILFASVGKSYTIPLFVENTQFNSTFVGYDDDVKDGHKTNHKVARQLVLNYWSKVYGQPNLLVNTELEKLLTDYSLDTENAEYNFNLGVYYENEGHTAPALSYFLRCAERSEDTDLAYEALIRGSYCYEKQGERDGSSRSLLWQAQSFRPDRPEAYFLLSRYAEKRSWWQDTYLNADLALRYCNFDSNPLRTDVEYPGKYGLLFEKAYSGWWWGKTEESKSLFLQILNDYKIKNEYEKRIKENLDKMGVEY